MNWMQFINDYFVNVIPGGVGLGWAGVISLTWWNVFLVKNAFFRKPRVVK